MFHKWDVIYVKEFLPCVYVLNCMSFAQATRSCRHYANEIVNEKYSISSVLLVLDSNMMLQYSIERNAQINFFFKSLGWSWTWRGSNKTRYYFSPTYRLYDHSQGQINNEVPEAQVHGFMGPMSFRGPDYYIFLIMPLKQ